jgi:hypothetical protein
MTAGGLMFLGAKGGELALPLASRFPALNTVVAYIGPRRYGLWGVV